MTTVAAKSLKPKASASAGRDDLLREAALMALLEHRNVMGLLGVVTVPRDLPPLVLMPYCEAGSLLDIINAAEAGRITLVEQLTFCAEILRGMRYLATRKIVHRDLAARNVLVNGIGRCMVSDFGMAVCLDHGSKSQYAAQYIRVHAEIALRWASPEAFEHERFSTASDVWAFGVTAWEVFALGVEPYANLGLGEIGVCVKGGKRLERPAGCPKQLFDGLMAPCWAIALAERPTFDELYETAVLLGAQEDDEAHEERKARFATRTVPAKLVNDRNHDAPSLQYLKAVLLPAVMKAATPVVEANRAGRLNPDDKHPILDVLDCSSYHLKDLIVVPQTLLFRCPRDRETGAAYVDMMPREHVDTATAILSYAWRYPLRLVVGALAEWCIANCTSQKDMYIWIDVICWNQHPGRLSDPEMEWKIRVPQIGRQLTMLHPWNKPIYCTRAWVTLSPSIAIISTPPLPSHQRLRCLHSFNFRRASPVLPVLTCTACINFALPLQCLFELWNAITLGKHCELDIILAPEDMADFRAVVNRDGYSIVDQALAGIQAEKAEAWSPDDLAKITNLVLSSPGGWATLNATVRNHLSRWFYSQGGIRIINADSMLAVPKSTSHPSPLPGKRASPRFGRVAKTVPELATVGLASAGGSSMRAEGSTVGRISDGDDGGYMDVEGTASPLNRRDSEESLITDTDVVSRLDSDNDGVMIADTGFAISRQEDDVLLVAHIGPDRSTDVASAPARLVEKACPPLQTTAL